MMNTDINAPEVKKHQPDINQRIFQKVFFLTLMARKEWFLPILYRLEESQYWDPERIMVLQQERLRSLLLHAKQNTAYYRDVIPNQVSHLDDLKLLPLLEKDVLREQSPALQWKGGGRQRFKTSGGSTGAPVTLLKDCSGMAQELAATWRGYRWAGVDIGFRQARFWGVPRNKQEQWRSKLIDFVCNRKRITAFNFNDESFFSALDALNNFKPNYFYGYTSIISEFADFLCGNGLSTDFSVESIITTSEVLTKSNREKISRVFGARIFDEYGCGEVGTIAHECEHGRLHLNSENLIVEVLDETGAVVEDGVPGQIVVTDLSNYSMPLIRYRLRDWGAISRDGCECGRTLPVLSGIYGRQYDILENSNGKKFHGEFFLYIVEDAKKKGVVLSGVQFLQNKDLSLTVLMQCDQRTFESAKQFFLGRLYQDFDTSLGYRFERVAKIPRDPSGKLRVVKKIIGDTV